MGIPQATASLQVQVADRGPKDPAVWKRLIARADVIAHSLTAKWGPHGVVGWDVVNAWGSTWFPGELTWLENPTICSWKIPGFYDKKLGSFQLGFTIKNWGVSIGLVHQRVNDGAWGCMVNPVNRQ